MARKAKKNKPISAQGKGAQASCLGVLISLAATASIPILIFLLYTTRTAESQELLIAFRTYLWDTAQCEITASGIKEERPGEFVPTIGYTHNVNGPHHGYRYQFTTQTWSEYEAQAIADRYPVGSTTTCYVNSGRLGQMVLVQGPAPDDWNLVALYVAALLVPSIVYYMLRVIVKRRTAAGKVARIRERAQTSGYEAPARGLPNIESGRPLEGVKLPTPTPDGRFALAPESGPVAKAALALFLLVFGGIFGGVPLIGVLSDSSGWFEYLFVIPFFVIGCGIFGIGVYMMLAQFNPRPELTMDMARIPVGGTANIEWRINGKVNRIRSLRLSLEGIESATYTRGTDTITDTETFYETALAETDDLAAMAWGSTSFYIPANAVPSFAARRNKIIWKISVKGDIPRWPDIDDDFFLIVDPVENGGGTVR